MTPRPRTTIRDVLLAVAIALALTAVLLHGFDALFVNP